MCHFPRLLDCREDADLSQTDVGNILGIDQRIYSNYETGKRKIPVNLLIKLAELYGTSTDYLLGLTNEKRPYPRKK